MSNSSFSLTLEDANTVSWVFGAVAIALTIGRYAIRWRIIRKFHADDIAHLAAVLFMIGELACYNNLIPTLHDVVAWGNGTGPEKPDEFTLGEQLSDLEHCLFISSLWAVKLAFMLMYRTLFKVSKPFNIAWWSVLAWNIVTYLMSMLTILWFCGGDPKYIANYQVCESEMSAPALRQIYVVTYVSVVSSDLAVMILPLYMLRTLRMRKGQKLGVGVIFSLSLVTIVFETVRLAKSFIGGNSLNVLWMHLEETFAVIISALPAYYSLFNWGKEWYSKRSSQQYITSNGSSPSRFSAMPPGPAQPGVKYHATVSTQNDEKCLSLSNNRSNSEDSAMYYKEAPTMPREHV